MSGVPIFWDDGGGGALQEADRQSGLAFGEEGSMAPRLDTALSHNVAHVDLPRFAIFK